MSEHDQTSVGAQSGAEHAGVAEHSVTAGHPATAGHSGTTGHPRVDEAVAALAAVRDAPPAEQVGPLTQAHRTLVETLDTVGDI